MASLYSQINSGIKDAMRARDKVRLATLRDAKSKFMLERSKTGATEELSDTEAIKILSKLQRQRIDTAEVYSTQDREDLASDELAQAEILSEFLPSSMTEKEIEAKVIEIISELGATGMGDMGKVMGLLKGKFSGRMDFSKASSMVKQHLT